jgi:hypothetical protein
MAPLLRRLLAAEQRAFLHRDRRGWMEHLARTRAFLGAGLAAADAARPVLILGAGAGLEVPWGQAPKDSWGWDADPWSRARTGLRHLRWPAWIFEDLTGGLEALEQAARRCTREPWAEGRARPRERACARLAGLLPSLGAEGTALGSWIARYRPGVVLSANVMGQFGVVAQRLLEEILGPWPWVEDPEELDPLGEALDQWIARSLRAHLTRLAATPGSLRLVFDRGVVHGGDGLALGAWTDAWEEQLLGRGRLEVEDPLCGVDPVAELRLRDPVREVLKRERWLWPVAPGQTHVVEAVALGPPVL